MNKTIRIAQISDCHLFEDPNKLLNDTNTTNNLIAVLNKVAEDNDWDFLLLSGDIADEGSPIAYKRIADLINKLQIPCYYTPGNHDNVNHLTQNLQGALIHQERHFTINNWQFILLNSTREGFCEGYLPPEELHFLTECLRAYPDLFAVVVLHHHPIPSHSFMDGLMLTEHEVFLKIIHQHPQVRSVLFGHIHQELTSLQGSALFLSAPATAYQIKPKQKQMIVDNLSSGYRWLELEYSGNIKTGITRL